MTTDPDPDPDPEIAAVDFDSDSDLLGERMPVEAFAIGKVVVAAVAANSWIANWY